jgi:hypothetical protein
MPAPHVAVADGRRLEGRVQPRPPRDRDPRLRHRARGAARARRGHARQATRARRRCSTWCVDDLGLADLTNWLSVLGRKLVLAKHQENLDNAREDSARARVEAGASRLAGYQTPSTLSPALEAVIGRMRAAEPGSVVEVAPEEAEAWQELERMSHVSLRRERNTLGGGKPISDAA